jgi:SAM-dependent methyltransferase
VTHGIRSILSTPWVYDAAQLVMGGRAARTEYARDVIRASKQSRVLDLGCGTAQVLAFLPEGADYWGYDISADYIHAAKQRYGPRGHFVCGIPTDAALADAPPFDIVLATGVLHHLNDDEARTLMKLARVALKPDGRFVSIDPVWADGQHPVARFLISKDRGLHVRDSAGYASLARREFSQVNGRIRHRAWLPYTHWIMECGTPGRAD